MDRDRVRNLTILTFLLGLAYLLLRLEFSGVLTLGRLREEQIELQLLWQHRPFFAATVYLVLGALLTAMPLPVVGIYHLSAGALFGFHWGLVLTLLGSTIGALLSFLTAKFWLRDWIQRRWGLQLAKINRAIQKEGSSFLLTLRLVPGFPFFLTNLAMGLTPMRTSVFFFTTLIGSLPVTAAIVNAGTKLSDVRSASDILSAEVLISLVLLTILSIGLRMYMRKKRIHEVFIEESA